MDKDREEDLDDGRDGDFVYDHLYIVQHNPKKISKFQKRGGKKYLQTIFLKSYMRQKVGLEKCKGKILLETFLQALQISNTLWLAQKGNLTLGTKLFTILFLWFQKHWLHIFLSPPTLSSFLSVKGESNFCWNSYFFFKNQLLFQLFFYQIGIIFTIYVCSYVEIGNLNGMH